MRRYLMALPLCAFLIAALTGVMCGKDPVQEPDPYETLSNERWIRYENLDVDGQKINITITFLFGGNKLYTYKQIGKRSSDQEEVPDYTFTEQGTYEITVPEGSRNEGTITFTPNDSEVAPYTVDWIIRPGDGHLILTYSDGKVLDLDIYRTSNN